MSRRGAFAGIGVDGVAGDALVGASVGPDIAAETQLHSTTSTDGLATMREQASLDASADGTLVLEPVGDQVMLVDLAVEVREDAP